MANLTVGQANDIGTVIHYLARLDGPATPDQANRFSAALLRLRVAMQAKLMAGPMEAETRAAIAAVEQLRADLAAYRRDTRHIIELRADGFTIQHPLACRPDLFGCAVNQAAHRDLDRPSEAGRFYCDLDSDGFIVIEEPADEPGVPPASNEARERECPQVNAGRTAAAAGLREHWAALYPDGTWTSGENRTREEAEEIIGFRDRLGVVAQPVLAVRWESDWRAFESEAD